MNALIWLGRHGRMALVAGLIAGVALPRLAGAMEALIVPGVALLLFLSALRVGPAAFRATGRAWRAEIIRAALLQCALPLAALGAMIAMGVSGAPLALGLVVTLAASPITGSAGIAVLAGADPAPALRAMAAGTALLPLTAIPVFAALPGLGLSWAMAEAVLRLLALVVVAGGGALALRAWAPGLGAPRATGIIDGAMTLALAVVVIALMGAVGPALRGAPGLLAVTFAAVCALCFGMQIAVLALTPGRDAPGLAIAAGTRNLALFFAALPEETRAPLMLWLGLYQIPMYLTPLVMGPIYARRY